MKRFLFAVGAMVLAAGLWVSPIGPASAEVVEALDASVDVRTPQEVVSPAGSLGVFYVDLTLEGPLPADVLLTNQLQGGAIETASSDISACGGSAQLNLTGDTLTCSVHLQPVDGTATATLRFVGRSSLVAQELVNVATAELSGGDTLFGIDIDESNDSASLALPVTNNGTISFVPEGGSASFRANAQDHVLTVVDAKGSGGGAIISMTDPGAMQCGAEACNGVRVSYFGGAQGEPFEALTQLDSSGYHDPCRGLGTSKCTGIFWRKLATDAMAPLPSCGMELPGDPCLVSKYKLGEGSNIHYVTAMDSDDPDIGLPGIPTAGGIR